MSDKTGSIAFTREQKRPFVISFGDPVAARLTLDGGKAGFEGNVDEAARIFFDHFVELYDHEIERLRTELSTAYRRGREDMREEAAKMADAYVANPMKPASGWNDQEAVAYRAGQIDVAASIETLIRKLEA